jgi:competence protein ComEC
MTLSAASLCTVLTGYSSMLSWMTAAIVGFIVVAYASVLPSFISLTIVLLLAFTLVIYQWQWRWLLLALVLAIAYATAYGHFRLAQLLPSQYDNQDINAVIKVLTAPEKRRGRTFYYRFDAELQTQILCDKQCAALAKLGRLRLNWYAGQPPSVGERIEVSLRLRRPHGFSSPGAFDYGRWLFVSGYSATGYIKKVKQLLPSNSNPSFSFALARERILRAWADTLQAYPQQGIMRALLFADRGDISSAQWTLFQKTGTSHLMAISGMHIGIVFAWGVMLGKALGIVVAGRRGLLLASGCGFLVAFIYAAMAGFSLPTQRALWMLAMALLAYLLRRNISWWQSYFAAMLAVLVFDPLAPQRAGFILSFAAVGTLLWSYQGRQKVNSLSLFSAQGIVFVGLLPALALSGFGLSVLAMPVNLLAIPLLTFVLLPLLFVSVLVQLVSPDLAALLWQFSDTLLGYWLSGLEWAAQLSPLLSLNSQVPVLILAAIAVLIVLLPRGLPAKWLAWLPIIALFYVSPNQPAQGALKVSVLDVGQGLSVLLQTRNHSLLYDVGADSPSGFNMADAVVLPALNAMGLNKLDVLVLSHADRDHAGAADELLAKIKVAEIYIGEPVPALPKSAILCRQLPGWQWDGVSFQFLNLPEPQSHSAKQLEGNNASCVLRVSTAEQSILLTGDIEAEIEIQLLDSTQNLRADILIAPHHGSKTSSSPAFIAAVAPPEVVFSAGRYNSYGHPAAKVLTRYAEQGVRCWSTGEQGSVFFTLENTQPLQTAYQRAKSYYWETPISVDLCDKFKSGR